MKTIPVLMYHALENAKHPANSADLNEQHYVLDTETFRRQMEYLWREGFSTVLLHEISPAIMRQERTVVLSFDDGHQSNYTLALPILRQFDYRAEFFITTNRIGTENYLMPKQISALHEAGMGIGSHGASHDLFDQMDMETAVGELQHSKNVLSAIIGREVDTFSAPGGRMPPTMEQLAQQTGYTAVFTSRPGYFSDETSRFSIPRFAMRCTTTPTDFAEILKQDQLYLLGQTVRTRALTLAKQMMGNRLYDSIKQQLLKGNKQDENVPSGTSRSWSQIGESAP